MILSKCLVESSTCEEIADRVDCSSGMVTRQSCENRGNLRLTYVFFLTLKPHTAVGITTCATTMLRVFR